MRYVVLAIEDNAQAETLVQDMVENPTSRLLTPAQENDIEATVVGMFQVPTKYCDPSDGHRGKKTEAGWTRGKKYGWWVCGACKKPTEKWAKNLNALLSSARNLLQSNDVLGAAQPRPTTRPDERVVWGNGGKILSVEPVGKEL